MKYGINQLEPKEKAKELFNMYWDLLMLHDVKHRRLFTKECALICVNELLKTVPYLNNTPEQIKKRIYYMDVREEIKKLKH